MHGKRAGRQQKRRPIRAAFLNAAAELGEEAARLAPGPGLGKSEAGGTPSLTAYIRPWLFARITANGGGGWYAWQAVWVNDSGTWDDTSTRQAGESSGLGSALELNGNTQVAVGMRVLLRRHGKYWYFQSGICAVPNAVQPPLPGPISPPTPTFPPTTPSPEPPVEPVTDPPQKDDPTSGPPPDEPTTGPYEPIWSYPSPFTPWDPWGNPIFLPIGETPVMTNAFGGISLTPPPPAGIRAHNPEDP